MNMKKDYYESELGLLDTETTIRVKFIDDNGTNTRFLNLNTKSADVLVKWLQENYFHVAKPKKYFDEYCKNMPIE